ncbi:MAG: hypothetical protein JWQ89_2212 [Devosia sp.]|uniref:GNAT family N-acetyltransferase n=1 Tax=Devosia sp. TaxID=1871048 RepID=UPI002619583B|nr:GNAT family N-acetyltransferase [Devosia sp.]MDB5540485.1 hypothetical protein [Devosia sp.]
MNTVPDHVLMARDLTMPIPTADWPDGAALAPMSAADAPAIHRLLQRAYANGFGSVLPDWLDWWEGLRGDSEFDKHLCFVASAGDEITGFCVCWTSSFVKDLVVAPDWQGRGVGTALLATAMAALEARGAVEVRLKVQAGNAGASRLYERMGFVAVGKG